MSSKPVALVLAVVAVTCGVGAVSVFNTGGRGPLWILGLVLGLGALALLVLSARLYTKGASSSRGRTEPISYSNGQRLGLIALAALAIAFGGHMIVTGKHKPSKGSVVTREKQPSEFWQMVLLYFGAGGALLYLGLRKPPHRARPRHPEPGPRDRVSDRADR
jgi:hypothetical protein